MLLSNKVPLDKRPTWAQMHWGCSSSALVHTHVGKGGVQGGPGQRGGRTLVSPSGLEGLSH